MNFQLPIEWSIAHGKSVSLGAQARIMGILNVTPDSFSDGGRYVSPQLAHSRGKLMLEQGADIIDVGGESTKPGSVATTGTEERARALYVIEELANDRSRLLSVDTYRVKTAAAGIEAGAHIINDVWGCQRESDIANVAADTGAGLVIMNTRRDREILPDPIEDAKTFLSKSLEIVHAAGVQDAQIVLDPGFGFSETTEQDIPILNRLDELMDLGYPLMVGTSRKRFIGDIVNRPADQRGVATAATNVVARLKGASLFRVHDIPENRDALAIADALIADRGNQRGSL